MTWPLGETLEYIEPYLSGQLVSAETFSRVKTMATILPEAMSSYYLECRLTAQANQVDFLTSALSAEGREILAGNSPKIDLSDEILKNSLWRRIRDFFKYWAEPTSPLYEQVPLIWLEFDKVSEALPAVPLPSLCFCLSPEYMQRGTDNHLSPQQYQKLIKTALEPLFNYPLLPQTEQNLFACFDLLPPDGHIIHISAMLARHPPTLKVYGCIPREQLLTYLRCLGWTGSIAEIDKFISTFCPTLNPIFIDLTVGDTIASRIGLAFSQIHLGRLPRSDPKWSSLLEQLVESSLCAPEKREGLLNWPGSSQITFRNEAWPTRLDRWLDLKIVYQPQQPLEAKGYLGFMPRFSLF
jgi:hypothetical protein